MQKIAYSTLAIAAPVVLQGCSDEDEQTTTPPKADCSTLSQQECEAVDNGHCNWNTPDEEPENCSPPEDFRETLASLNDSPAECEEYGGIRVQPCKKVRECSDYLLAEINSRFDGQGLNRPNGKITFTEAYAALGESALNNVIEVRFSNADTGTFNVVGADAANPDNLCTGYLHATLSNFSLAISPAANPETVQNFNCGAAEAVADSFAALTYSGEVVPIANDFGTNVVYDALFYDACSDDTMCGMNMDGTCAPIEDFCAQFDAFTCPTTYEKDNVKFIQGTVGGVEAEVIANSMVCEHVHLAGEPILDENDQPTFDEDENQLFYDVDQGCKTLEGLELVTCEASPFPSFGETSAVNPAEPDPSSPTLERVDGDDMCNLWLADASEWEGDNQSARAIYYCPVDDEFARLNDGTGEVECVNAAGAVNANGPSPTVSVTGTYDGPANGRACELVGDRTETGIVKECALPREFSCGAPDAGANAGEECIIKPNICVYDDGNRDFCGEPGVAPTGTEDSGEESGEDSGEEVDGLRDSEDDTQ